MVLNSLTEEEWIKLKLPPIATCVHKPNVQLPDVEQGSCLLAQCDTLDVVLAPDLVLQDVSGDARMLPWFGRGSGVCG